MSIVPANCLLMSTFSEYSTSKQELHRKPRRNFSCFTQVRFFSVHQRWLYLDSLMIPVARQVTEPFRVLFRIYFESVLRTRVNGVLKDRQYHCRIHILINLSATNVHVYVNCILSSIKLKHCLCCFCKR